ncbi:hypothetical protein LP420_27410 [Massilia sp. B-10]|nr:hypothetical protein LP420_27410 [Massilia sp. B-10]
MGLDAVGSRFDAKGRPRAWWSKADQAHFKQAMAPLARQYSAYKAFPDLALNGERTLNSNHADLTGLTLAYAAYRNARARNGAPDDKAADQRFFLAYAESLRFQEHRPGAARPGCRQPCSHRPRGAWPPCAIWMRGTARSMCGLNSSCTWRPQRESRSGRQKCRGGRMNR